jgi:transketolase
MGTKQGVSRPFFDTSESQRRCADFRLRILAMSERVTALHIAPAFSCIEITDAIYSGLMHVDYENGSPDTFIMSKGHGYLTQLVILESLGVIPASEIDRYCTPEGVLGAHPDLGTPGIAAATGSLGHGLGMSIGIAIAERNIAANSEDHPGTVFVVLSDGELQEGSTWESIMLAPSLGVRNLVAVIDNNDYQSLGKTSETHPSLYPLAEKFESFGWEASTVDGHDSSAIVEAVASRVGDRPFMLVAKTTKGKGVSFMENMPVWHYRAPSAEERALAVSEIVGR